MKCTDSENTRYNKLEEQIKKIIINNANSTFNLQMTYYLYLSLSCAGCENGKRACRSGACVEESHFCDGVKDCPDGFDEMSCTGQENGSPWSFSLMTCDVLNPRDASLIGSVCVNKSFWKLLSPVVRLDSEYLANGFSLLIFLLSRTHVVSFPCCWNGY